MKERNHLEDLGTDWGMILQAWRNRMYRIMSRVQMNMCVEY
jgi:hypothetical protein